MPKAGAHRHQPHNAFIAELKNEAQGTGQRRVVRVRQGGSENLGKEHARNVPTCLDQPR